MAFVKLDCGILRSTIWMDLDARNVFLTALLMAEPREFPEPIKQIHVDSLEFTGWEAPPGWYGYVPASGPGILHAAKVGPTGAEALRQLGEPDPGSRSQDFDGRRLIRIDGGYLCLNYIRYRDRDSTTAERSRRWRERKKEEARAVVTKPVTVTRRNAVKRVTDTPTRVIRHQAEAEAEADPRERAKALSSSASPAESAFDAFWNLYPRKVGKGAARKAWLARGAPSEAKAVLAALEAQKAPGCQLDIVARGVKYTPHPSTWLNQRRWEDAAEVQTAGREPAYVPSKVPPPIPEGY